ncbi:MAG: DUF4249 family protein [Candidatus Glassbacteria bacterium]|nr:DUF4249 family protein [Candidatus Glassbacteria bacterium]
MRRVYFWILLPCLAALTGCTGETAFAPGNQLVVVQGYLHAGRQVSDIRLTSTLGLGSRDTLSPPINDAQVQLIKNGICYLLEPVFGKQGYYSFSERILTEGDCPGGDCPDAELSVETGDVFRLEVFYFDKVATAETTVPPPPVGVAVNPGVLRVSAGNYHIPGQYSSGGLFAEDTAVAVTVSWQDDGRSMYYMTMSTLEINPPKIDPDCPLIRPGEYFSPSITGDHFPIGWSNITHYGRHRIRIYRFGQEYVDMYLTRNQDTRDLNEPLTNIDNGLGVFTAVNSVDLYFNVEQ